MKPSSNKKHVKLLISVDWLEQHKHPSETDAGFFYRICDEWEQLNKGKTLDDLLELMSSKLNNCPVPIVDEKNSNTPVYFSEDDL